jgi:hypothetical protein
MPPHVPVRAEAAAYSIQQPVLGFSFPRISERLDYQPDRVGEIGQISL